MSVLPSPGRSSSSTLPPARMPGEHQPEGVAIADDDGADRVQDSCRDRPDLAEASSGGGHAPPPFDCSMLLTRPPSERPAPRVYWRQPPGDRLGHELPSTGPHQGSRAPLRIGARGRCRSRCRTRSVDDRDHGAAGRSGREALDVVRSVHFSREAHRRPRSETPSIRAAGAPTVHSRTSCDSVCGQRRWSASGAALSGNPSTRDLEREDQHGRQAGAGPPGQQPDGHETVTTTSTRRTPSGSTAAGGDRRCGSPRTRAGRRARGHRVPPGGVEDRGADDRASGVAPRPWAAS